MSKKWADPIDKLLAADQKAKSLNKSALDLVNAKSIGQVDKIVTLDPIQISLWKYKDRPANELGDLNLLAKKLVEIGQQQPCIVRPHKEKKGKFELIAGERRWRASKIANINLKVIIKDLDDHEASLVQEEENYSTPLSDYARGMHYSRIMEDNIITFTQLTEKLGISKQKLSRLLSFSQIPSDVVSAIGDMSRISAGTAEKIKQLCNKGIEYKERIIWLSDKIREKELGHEKLNLLVERHLNNEKNNNYKKTYKLNDTLSLKLSINNSGSNIKLDNYIIKSVKKSIISKEDLLAKMREVLDDILD